MKPILKFTAYILLSGTMIFISCSKENPANNGYYEIPIPPLPPLPVLPPDTLSGREFIFNDLTWALAGPGAVADTEVWITVANRPDLFSIPRQLEVSIRLDSSTVWIIVPQWNWPSIPSNSGYLHVITYGLSFYVESYPVNFQLIGRRASLRIKFL